MLWVFLVLAVVLCLTIRRYRIRRIIQVSKKIKCDLKCYPFVGHAYLFMGDGINRMRAFQNLGREAIKNGGLTNVWLGSHYYVMVVDPVDLEVILKSSLEKDDIMRFARNLVGNGTIFAPVSIWRPRRKVLAPTFSPKNLNNFVKIFSRQSGVMVEQMRHLVGKGPVSVWKFLTSYTMDSVCETALGVEVNAQNSLDEPFLKAFEECSKLVAIRMLQPWLYSDAVYKLLPSHASFESCKRVLCGFVNKVIQSKRNAAMENNNEQKHNSTHDMRTFLELLIDASGGDRGYSDLELQEETLVIVVAGTDTSAVGASFVVSMLARHLEVQELVYKEETMQQILCDCDVLATKRMSHLGNGYPKPEDYMFLPLSGLAAFMNHVFEELQEVFGESDRPVTFEDLPRLKYLDAVVRETLRLYPPVPIIVRKVEKDLKLPSGITLVEGCGVMVHIWGTQRNPQYWGDDAEVFRPERFIDTPLKHPAAFLAFSHGPRNCLGYQYAMMSMKTALATLIRRYWVSTSGLSKTNGCYAEEKSITVTFDVMMKDVDRFTVQLDSRK